MMMAYRKEILIHLYRILEKNATDARVYFRLADKCNRSTLKCFFKKLSLQKRYFCRRIRYEIGELEKEIEIIEEKSPLKSVTFSGNTFTGSFSSQNEMRGIINYCYEREREYLEMYQILLSKTNMGNIREMLLSQKHSVKLGLNELNTIENRLYKAENEKEMKFH